MSEFLKAWDQAIEAAHLYGQEACLVDGQVWRFPPAYGIKGRVVARTMHPAFMQPKVPKHDPARDAIVRLLGQDT